MKISTKSTLISNIKKCSFEDGPGIRTTVFLKGCPMRCSWCHNPENYESFSTLSFEKALCINCGKCKKVCTTNAIFYEKDEWLNKSCCTRCFKCVGVCPSKALKKVGEYIAPKDLANIIISYKTFYDSSGGGVTFSGGEPLQNMEYISKVANFLIEERINIAVQTAGYFDYDLFEENLLFLVNIVYFDLKIFDLAHHQKHTGVSNILILNNFKRLVASGIKLVPRLALIPFVTDTKANMNSIVEFLNDNKAQTLVTLPFNPLFENKRKMSGIFENKKYHI